MLSGVPIVLTVIIGRLALFNLYCGVIVDVYRQEKMEIMADAQVRFPPDHRRIVTPCAKRICSGCKQVQI